MMDASSSGPAVKKQEEDDKSEKRDVKPVVKTLNRVPRELSPGSNANRTECMYQLHTRSLCEFLVILIVLLIICWIECLQKAKDEMRGC